MLWRNDQFAKIYDMMIRTYFIRDTRGIKEYQLSDIVYYNGGTVLIDEARQSIEVNKSDKNLNHPTAKHWTEHLMEGYSIDFFVFIDALLYCISFVCDSKSQHRWIHVLAGYSWENKDFKMFLKKLQNEEYLKEYAPLFGKTSEDTAALRSKIENLKIHLLTVFNHQYYC